MVPESSQQGRMSGFEGAVAGLHLADVIQLKGHNRFSGCIVVEYGALQGMIFMRDGEVIHAEQGGNTGEAAFHEIIKWPGGRFVIQQKVTTTSRTIRHNLGYLLLEAHRLMDEGNAGMAAPPSPARERRSAVAEKLMQLAGVAYAVLQTKDGTPLEDESFEAKALAEKGIAVARCGMQLGELFGAGEVKSVAFQDRSYQLLVFEAKHHLLTVAARAEFQLGQVETDIRAALTARK